MTDTPRTGLEFVDAGTTDIDQPVNNNALALDAVVGMNVVSATTTAEPTLTSPTDDGKVYIIPAGATGTNWAAQATGTIAQWYSSNWYFYAPWAGLQARAADTGIRYQYTTSWAVYASVGAQSALAGTGGTAGFLRGDGTVSSALTGGFSVDTNVLFVDDTNNRIGVNTSTPQRAHHIVGPSGPVASFPSGPGAATALIVENNANSSFATVFAAGSSSSFSGYTSGAAVAAFSFTYNDTTGIWGFTVGTGNPLSLEDDTVTITVSERRTGIQTQALTANTDNLTLNATAATIRFTSNGAYDLTGITGGAVGRRVRLLNASAFTITLKHDATSTAANRFFTPNNADFAIRQNGACDIEYDTTSSRWRVIGA